VNKKKVVYVQTSDSGIPERVYAPFILAIDAAATGIDATIYFFLRGVTILKKGKSEKVQLDGYPPFDQMIDQAVQSGVTLEACEQSCILSGLKKQDLIDNVKIVGASTLNDRILEADGILSF
jgi:hypothetical protein